MSIENFEMAISKLRRISDCLQRALDQLEGTRGESTALAYIENQVTLAAHMAQEVREMLPVALLLAVR